MNNDLISRQDAIDALEEQLDYLQMLNKNENPTAEGKWYGVNWARNTIADLPYKQNERPKESELVKAYLQGFNTGVEIVKNARLQGEFVEKLKDRIQESICNRCPMNNKCVLCEISRVFQIITLTAEELKGGAE